MKHQEISQTAFNGHDIVTRWVRTLAMPMAVMAGVGCVDSQSDDEDQTVSQEYVDIVEQDGFVNPLSGKTGTTEANDGDKYYSALDWSKLGPAGPHHCGEDWNDESGGNSDYGAPVYATANGKVVSVKHHGPGWGKIIMIEHHIPTAGHPNYVQITSTYAHLSKYSVSVGAHVDRGDKIGEVGDADGYYVNAAHLHFEMRWDETLSPTANDGYNCPDEQSGTFDPTDFIDAHPPGWG
jgi:murein DD-endopeptidase MepM/ murein hydrolase activator NlpD